MAVIKTTLNAKPREGAGKGNARQLRAQGLIPAVVYGKHLEKPAHIAVDPLGIRQAIATPHKFNTLISLTLDGHGERLVLLKEYQQDPVTRQILHADFVHVRENERIKVKIPLVLVGKPVGVAEGGILSQARRELEVWAMPEAIPEKIEADVSALKIGSALHVNDLKYPSGVEVKTHVNYTVAVVTAPEKEEVVAPVAAAVVPGAPAAPGEAAPAAPGAAPAAPGAAAPAKDAKAAAAPAPAKGAAPPAKKEEAKKDDKKK
jgi:large subunit ribosomal protein L25